MSSIALVLFAKNPYLSPVKTRLEKETSKDFALDFYQKSLRTTIQLLQNLKFRTTNTTFYIAVAEESGLDHQIWHDYNKVSQGGGGLGEKLNKVYHELSNKFDAVFFFGADSPFISQNLITTSIDSFLHSDKEFIIGPSLDGGFYMFGGKAPIEKNIWNAVEYSTNQTCKQLMELISEFSSYIEIEKQFDIDEIEDFAHLSKLEESQLSPNQQELFHWIKHNTSF